MVTTTTEAAPPVTTGAPTSSTIEAGPDLLVVSAYEAFCTGFVAGIDDFGDALSETEWWSNFGSVTWEQCMVEFSPIIDETAADVGMDIEESPLEDWYVHGCRLWAIEYNVLEFGPLSDESSPDAETRQLFAELACATPFSIASDAGWEFEILRSGVCFHLDFDPTQEQIDSGMVPCLDGSRPASDPSTTSEPPVLSIQDEGYWLDLTPVDEGDIAGGVCSGFMAALWQMSLEAQERPDDFYPLPDPTTATCPDVEVRSSNAQQAFCEGWTSFTLFGTVTLDQSPESAAVMVTLFEACMGAHFAMNPDTTPAYEFPIYEHQLFEEGFICYPPDSGYWDQNPDVPPSVPYVARCDL